jgi:hypothetical protein
VQFCWQLSRTGYQLQARKALGGMSGEEWELLPAVQMQAVGNEIQAMLPIDLPQRFFRLYRPPPILNNPD